MTSCGKTQSDRWRHSFSFYKMAVVNICLPWFCVLSSREVLTGVVCVCVHPGAFPLFCEPKWVSLFRKAEVPSESAASPCRQQTSASSRCSDFEYWCWVECWLCGVIMTQTGKNREDRAFSLITLQRAEANWAPHTGMSMLGWCK